MREEVEKAKDFGRISAKAGSFQSIPLIFKTTCLGYAFPIPPVQHAVRRITAVHSESELR
jgi:hypothetical protein